MIVNTILTVLRAGLTVQRENELKLSSLTYENKSLIDSINLNNSLMDDPKTEYMLFLKKFYKYMKDLEYYKNLPIYQAITTDIDNIPLSSNGIFSENKMVQQICSISILSSLLILSAYFCLDYCQFFNEYLINATLLSDIELNIGTENYQTLMDILSSIQDNPKSIKIAIILLADFNEVLKKQGFNINSLNKIITILFENME